jgi:coenzyme F420-reducing hydrogenase gamma subunit
VERKEAIWVAQEKLNRVVDERRRGSRRQNLDRYVPANRWVPIDRYIPGVPYDANPHMLAMRLFSRTVA